MCLYISLNRTIDQTRDLGLENPTRIGKQGKQSASGTAYEKEDRFSQWSRAESVPSQQQQRVMFNALIYKRDLAKAYRQFPIDPLDYQHLGYFWQGQYYFGTVDIFQSITKSLRFDLP